MTCRGAQLPFATKRKPSRDLSVTQRDGQKVVLPDNRPTLHTLEFARQSLRALGLMEIRDKLREMFPLYSRKQIRQLAFELQHEAWRERDKEAVARFLHP